MAIVAKYLVMGSVICLMLGVGLRTSFPQVIGVSKDVPLVGRGLAANFIAVPFLIGLALIWLPLSPYVKVGIMLMAAAPVAPMAPPFVTMAKGDLPYAVGLMTVVGLLSVPLTPAILGLALPESLGGVGVDPVQIVKTLLQVQLIPLAAGMALLQARPDLAEKAANYVSKLGQIGLLLGVGLILVMQAEQILAIQPLAYLTMLALVVMSLVVGDLFMAGESAARRRALAVSTAIRNIALAFLIANQSFGGTSAAPTTLIFAVMTIVLSVAYAKLMAPKEMEAEVGER
jgi:BASS family bile acid:Na+ symporter